MKINKNKTEMRKKQLADAISYTQQLKISINEYSKQLDILYLDKKISTKDYEKNKKEIFKNRSLEQWNNYYDDYIKSYKNELKQLSLDNKKSILFFLIALSIIALFGFSSYTGYDTYIDNFDNQTNNDTNEILILEDSASIQEDYASLMDYPDCPSLDGIITIDSRINWNTPVMECINITIDAGGVLILNSTGAGNTTINITAENLYIHSNGILTGYSTGYLSRQGTALTSSTSIGASHASYGAGSSKSPYGSIEYPLTMGSGGSSATRTATVGGGSMFINVSGTLTNNGIIDSNATFSAGQAGASGGSIYIIAGTFAGSGFIESIGGRASTTIGGGSGGRIAIYYNTKTFTGIINASGGQGSTAAGGPGTIFLKGSDHNYGVLIIDSMNRTNPGRNELNSSFLQLTTLDQLNISNHAKVYLTSPLNIKNNLFNLSADSEFFQFANFTADNLSLMTFGGTIELTNNYSFNENAVWNLYGNANLSHRNNSEEQLYFINITAKNFTINSNSKIDVSYRGHAFRNGLGAGLSLNHGAGYGGTGGNTQGGSVYGSITEPKQIGSGGGHNNAKGSGGGLVILNITDTFVNEGAIYANSSGNTGSTGAGSGGGILIYANNFSGNGSIYAFGGRGLINTGSGGGGRIAIYYTENSFTGDISASSLKPVTGTRTFHAGAGTIYLKSSSETCGDLIINNNGLRSLLISNTTLTSDTLTTNCLGNLTISNQSIVILKRDLIVYSKEFNLTGDLIQRGNLSFPNLANITIWNATLELSSNYTFNESAVWMLNEQTNFTHFNNSDKQIYSIILNAKNFTINSGASINVCGKGYDTNSGPGTPSDVSTFGGGGYGGYGGRGSSSGLGQVYGSLTAPLDLGSGGTANAANKARGGGSVFLNISDTITIYGLINASSPFSSSSGTGSGGSIYLIANKITGNGTLEVNSGRQTYSTTSGTGGGGRVAIYSKEYTFSGLINTSAGSSTGRRGQEGTIFICQSISGVNCYSAGNVSVAVSNGSILLKTEYQNNASININKTMNVTFTQNSVNWTDEATNFSLLATSNISDLFTSSSYDIYDNTTLNSNQPTDASGILTSFTMEIVGTHEVSVMNTSSGEAPSVVGITLDDSTIAFGSGHYDPSCTSDYGLLNSNTTNNCWINTTEFPSLDDTHNITNNGTVNVNVSSYVILTDAEEAFCGTSQGCTLTNLAKISIISQENGDKSCVGLNEYGALASQNSNSTQGVCNSLGFASGSNHVKTFIELFYPKDSTPGAKSITIVYEAIAV